MARPGRDPWPPTTSPFPIAGEALTADQGVDRNDELSFVQTAGDVAPGGALVAGVVNRTGKTVPTGAWAWGTKTVAGTGQAAQQPGNGNGNGGQTGQTITVGVDVDNDGIVDGTVTKEV